MVYNYEKLYHHKKYQISNEQQRFPPLLQLIHYKAFTPTTPLRVLNTHGKEIGLNILNVCHEPQSRDPTHSLFM
jgi:hypothetical protein